MAAKEVLPVDTQEAVLPGVLSGIRVIELADEQAEYCGLTLAGLGADVVKVEPPGGSPTRHIGPFYKDQTDPERSLFFWQFNRGKRSIELDLDQEKDRVHFESLLSSADILLESTPKGELDALGLGAKALEERLPALIHARVTPFGDDGPWKDYKASDLVHLALGGVMMNCGYDPTPDGTYDLPPIAPQMWHAYHVAGEQLSMAILAALMYRFRTGQGQQVSCAIHEAVAKCTEVDLMSWVMRRSPVLRQTCRHARETISPHPTIAHTKDGRWVMASLGTRPGDGDRLMELLDRYGIESGMDPQKSDISKGGRFVPGTGPVQEKRDKGMEAMQRFVRCFTYDNVPWREAQELGMLWAPLRKPHENALDPHWLARKSCADIEHPELGRSFRYATGKWIGTATGWSTGRRAPLLNEDADTVDTPLPSHAPVIGANADALQTGQPSRRGKPFALDGIRILDFTWFLASAGGTRFMSAFGAESLKVELKSPSGYPHGLDGSGRWPRSARKSDRPSKRRNRFRHGRAIQQQEPWQAGYLAQRPSSQRVGDRAQAGVDFRYRRRGLLARRAGQLGPRIRCAERDKAGHHIRAAVRYGRAGNVWPLPYRRPHCQLLLRVCPKCPACPNPRCPRVGAIPTWIGWAPTASRSRC